MPSTFVRAAPSAMRMPNSCVRWLTENATTPAIPAAVITSASSPNSPSSVAVSRRRRERGRADFATACGSCRPADRDRSRARRRGSARSIDRRIDACCAPASWWRAGRSGTSAGRARRAPVRFSCCRASATTPTMRRPRCGRRRRRSRWPIGILARPVVPRQRLVDDHDRRGVRQSSLPRSRLSPTRNVRPQRRGCPIVAK